MLILAALLSSTIIPEAPNLVFKQPQLAARNGVIAATFGAGNAVYFSASRDQGNSFSKPVVVAQGPFLALGRHRGPRIAVTSSGTIVISAIIGQKRFQDGDLISWRSTDGGKTWSKSVTMNDVPAAAREGLHAMAAGPGELVFAAWLDLRSKGMKLYGARSQDGGATWSKNELIYQSPDGHICECCHPSVAIDAQGRVYVMWRNWLGGSRDMYLARSRDGGKTFEPARKLGAGTWPLKACPMDGGGLAIAADGKAVTIWRRQSTVYQSEEDSPETSLGSGKDPALAIGKKGVYAVWTTPAGVYARVPGRSAPLLLAEQAAFPQLTATPDGGVIAAWEENGRIQFRQLP